MSSIIFPLEPFISKDDFITFLTDVIRRYFTNFNEYDLSKITKNKIDPFKLMLDKTVYGNSWTTTIKNEIIRQIDKQNNNLIGEMHQNLFAILKGKGKIKVLDSGDKTSRHCDIKFILDPGYHIPNLPDSITEIYIEIKNKYNTMNASSAKDIYQNMTNITNDRKCAACFVVEVISRKGNIDRIWNLNDKSNPLIRIVSIDKFYSYLTGMPDFFYNLCKVFADTIQTLISSEIKSSKLDSDLIANQYVIEHGDDDKSFASFLFKNTFKSYIAFK